VFVNELDMKEWGIAPDALVEIESVADTVKGAWRGASRRGPTPPRRVRLAQYYPETDPLLPLSHHDLKSKTPAAKSIPVLVRPQ
jgi:hypothetical protein